MLQSLPTIVLGGLVLTMPIIGIVRLRGGRFNWATLVAIFTAMTRARCIQAAAWRPEQPLPLLWAALIGPCTLLAMPHCACHTARRSGQGNAA
ncbi:hypothetical protein [Xanthomonas fragariae]|uniref:hypothetical protein n=1 Tax=Xanthomonas fragariae TaxID=48664 RepID=UPI001ABE1057|nr:hypothetical protein [Xanthomonas fragariae]UKR51962.1 hypothetical protein K4A87_14850 [Xanthomonas fragariae]